MTRIEKLQRHPVEELHTRLAKVIAGDSDVVVYKKCRFRSFVVSPVPSGQPHILTHEEVVYCQTGVDPDDVFLDAQIDATLLEEFQVSLFDLAGVMADPGFLSFNFEGSTAIQTCLPPIIEFSNAPKGMGLTTVPVVVRGAAILWLAHRLGRSCSAIAVEGIGLPTPYLPLVGTPGTEKLTVAKSPLRLPRGFAFQSLVRDFDKAFKV